MVQLLGLEGETRPEREKRLAVERERREAAAQAARTNTKEKR